jgi:hypothetical protein
VQGPNAFFDYSRANQYRFLGLGLGLILGIAIVDWKVEPNVSRPRAEAHKR